jgi:NADPH2 dehydrogenase
MTYKKIAALRDAAAFRTYTGSLGIEVGCDDTIDPAVFAAPLTVDGMNIGNRFCVLPMEGWDGTTDGKPSDLTTRRWHNFGKSGAGLIWGEATAVRPDARANPNQLIINKGTVGSIEELRQTVVGAHRESFGSTDGLVIGLQLTHSGRFSRPTIAGPAPVILYHHPVLDAKFKISDSHPVLSDGEIDDLIGQFVAAAVLAREAGFEYVDIKHCHGYLGHEFLSAVERPGRYGGSFENRTRFLREVAAGIRRDVPGLKIAVRLSAFDFVPFKPGAEWIGVPEEQPRPYGFAFGGSPESPDSGINFGEPDRFLALLEELEIRLVCITAGSPYYTPHIQRPALFPPSDGYLPPEDPLVGVSRQLDAVAELKRRHPGLTFVGSAYSYLQEFLPQVAQHELRTGRTDLVGLGRMILSYPELPADVLAARPMQRKRVCRTFSDCTTAPRNHLPSGCYPLDPFYQAMPEAAELDEAKKALREKMKAAGAG